MNRFLLVTVAIGGAVLGAAVCWLVMRTEHVPKPAGVPTDPRSLSALAVETRRGKPAVAISPRSAAEPAEDRKRLARSIPLAGHNGCAKGRRQSPAA